MPTLLAVNIEGFALLPALMVGLGGPTPAGTHYTGAHLHDRPDGDQLLLVTTSAGDVIAVVLAEHTEVALGGPAPCYVLVNVGGEQTLVGWVDDPGAPTREVDASRLLSWAVPVIRVKDLVAVDEMDLDLSDDQLSVALPNTATGLTEVIHIPLCRDPRLAALLLESQWAVLRAAADAGDRVVPVFGGADTDDTLGGPAFR